MRHEQLSDFERKVHASGEAHVSDLGQDAKGLCAIYTPPRLARFVVRIADLALRHVGLAGMDSAHVVDPACGVGTFAAAVRTLHPKTSVSCFDIDAGALALANNSFEHTDRISFSHCDALQEGRDALMSRHFGETVAVIGNPPWSSHDSHGLEALMADFRKDEHGSPLEEKKIGVLSEAYLRFWRLGCEIVENAKEGGAVALVTNSSFLNGPVHRGVRACLLRWFDTIDVFDLGGSALVSKVAGAGRDENVFPVRPGTCVVVAARGPTEHNQCSITHVRGDKESKLQRLSTLPLRGTSFSPKTPFFVFGEQGTPFPSSWVDLSQAMPFHQEGLQTNRDALLIDKDEMALRSRLALFALELKHPQLEHAQTPQKHYAPKEAAKQLRELGDELPIIPIAYRPFDDRHCCIASKLCHRPRLKLIEAMKHSSRALLTVRKDRGEAAWSHASTSRYVVDNSYFSSRSGCRTRAFPESAPDGSANIDGACFEHWPAVPSALELISIALTVLCSKHYRQSFDATLKLDYPHLPTPPTEQWMQRAIACGDSLASFFESGYNPEAANSDHDPWLGHRRLRCPPEILDLMHTADDLLRPLCDQSQ